MEQNNESLALKVVNESLKLPFIKIDRSEFLIKTFGEQVDDIQKLIDEGPQVFFSKEELDESAKKVINSNILQSSSLSFVSGLPGGFAMAATIPADIAQFFGYSLKLAQEISYIYGYKNLWSEQGELTEDAKKTLILYLGVMLGITSAGAAVRILSNKLALQALKKIPQKALTKTIYYPIIKKVMAIFGAKLTKDT
ncbi:MAG: bacteriochlorophyll 4-vinyl reductase, partial [Lactococcus chungangensis]